MIDIVLAKNAGFCFGVRRAIELVDKTLEENSDNVYSLGPVIHNEFVLDKLAKKGLKIIDKSDLTNIFNSTIVIRSHGVEKNIYEIIDKNNNKIVDLTCPFVKKIHKLVEKYADLGKYIIVIGDPNHAEVQAIISYANNDISVISSKEDINGLKIPENQEIVVLFQTTANIEKSKKLVDILTNLFYNKCLVVNTICNATIDRQNEVNEISKNVDSMIIIGSKQSSNTKKLYDVSKVNCDNTYLINDVSELSKIKNIKNQKVGISAGASTPDDLIEEIVSNARIKF